MQRPFPGMDPYLESAYYWSGVHIELIYNIVSDLQPQLVPRYVARPEQRVLLAPIDEELRPDVLVREKAMPHGYVEIRHVQSRQVVTVIEVLSPWNKTGTGLAAYREKQRSYLDSRANLVEIDLLRAGQPAVALPPARLRPSDYRVCIHSSGSSTFGLIRFSVRDPLPRFEVPLLGADAPVVLHLGTVFARAYEVGAYAYDVNYREDPDPPLAAAETAWATERILEWRAASGRSN
jgi:hypothetical protein